MDLKTKVINLNINEVYEDFKDFYDNNIENIYDEIIDCFKYFKDSSVDNINLLVNAKIQNLEWDTEFKFDKMKINILIDDLLPYYQQNELFEKCTEIRDLHDQLIKIKGEN